LDFYWVNKSLKWNLKKEIFMEIFPVERFEKKRMSNN
jgi:hypothetical protein